jgi:peptidoglycan hydrolase-like protein with peptidoglycan-binding domain
MITRTKAARTATLSGVLLVATLGVAGLSVSAAPPDSTVPSPTVPSPTETSVAPPTGTDDSSVVITPGTTTAPTTTSTVAPTDTVATLPPGTPTTTPYPLPPAPVLPSNVENVAPAETPLQAVGSRSGPATQVLQQRLLDLGFWDTAPDGKYGFATTQAVMAFQKYTGLSPSGKVDKATAAALTAATEKAHGLTNAGTLVEVDKGRQVLFIVVDGKTQWAFNTSTGSGIAYSASNHNDPTKTETGDAQTPTGLYKTNRERPEGWWEGDLGKIYRPKYFNGGIAVHGMTSVPNHPASHGCVRLSTMAMDFIWDNNLIPLRMTVWVHA